MCLHLLLCHVFPLLSLVKVGLPTLFSTILKINSQCKLLFSWEWQVAHFNLWIYKPLFISAYISIWQVDKGDENLKKNKNIIFVGLLTNSVINNRLVFVCNKKKIFFTMSVICQPNLLTVRPPQQSLTRTKQTIVLLQSWINKWGLNSILYTLSEVLF